MSPDLKPRSRIADKLKSDILEERISLKEAAEEALARLVAKSQSVDLDQTFDVLLVGAGVAELTVQMRLADLGSQLNVLTIDAGKSVAPVFSDSGKGFYLNSTSKPPTDSLFQKPGEGDLNRIPYAPLQVADVSVRKYPVAEELGQVATINRGFYSDNPVLFGSRLISYTEKKNYVEVKLADGRLIKTKKLVFTSGLGKSGKPILAPEALDLMAKYPKRIKTSETVKEEIKNDRKAFEQYIGKTISIVGAGDNGNVDVSWLLRLGPENSYGSVPVGAGAVKKIIWHGQRCDSCEDFVTKNRSRYAEIGQGFRSGTIQPLPEKLFRFTELDNGRFKVTAPNRMKNSSGESDIIILASGLNQSISSLRKRESWKDQDKILADQLDSFIQDVEKDVKVSGVGLSRSTSQDYTIRIPKNTGVTRQLVTYTSPEKLVKPGPTIFDFILDGFFQSKLKPGPEEFGDNVVISSLPSKREDLADLEALELRFDFSSGKDGFFRLNGSDTSVVQVIVAGVSADGTSRDLVELKYVYDLAGASVNPVSTNIERILKRLPFSKIFDNKIEPDVVTTDYEGREVKLGFSLSSESNVNPPRVFAAGTAALEFGSLTSERERVGVGANGVSMFLILPRTSLFVDKVLIPKD